MRVMKELSAVRPVFAACERRSAKNGQYQSPRSGAVTVLDESVFEPADASDLIDSAREGRSIPLDIDSD